jgi:prepilin-type N-terminal cleavage/methylation domain-containing protein
MFQLQLKNRESGFTLLELLLVIGVAALLLIGGIFTYRLVSDGNKATDATRLLLTIRQEAQTEASQNGGKYTGIAFASATSATTSPLVTSGVLRDQQSNPFNGAIIVGPAGATDNQLSVEFDNISQSACVRLGQSINNPNEVVSITVNGTAVGTIPTTSSALSATGMCDTAVNKIVWVFP